MPARPRPGTVERKIYFYRVNTDLENEGDPEFDPMVAVQRISQLTFVNGARYLSTEDGNDVCVWPFLNARGVRLQLGVVRRAGLPLLEDGGNVIPLPIGDNQGLLEPIHIVFFPNGILGAEFNFYGPRVSWLPVYLREKLPDLPRVRLDMLVRQDVQDQLLHMQNVRIARLRLHRSHFDLAQQADESLFEAFRAAQDASQAVAVELELRPERYSRQGLPGRALNWVRILAGNPRINEAAEVFKVQALDDRTGHYEWFDLLKDYLVTSRSVNRLPGRQRGVDSDSMFRAIEEAYTDLRDSLEHAAGLGE